MPFSPPTCRAKRRRTESARSADRRRPGRRQGIARPGREVAKRRKTVQDSSRRSRPSRPCEGNTRSRRCRQIRQAGLPMIVAAVLPILGAVCGRGRLLPSLSTCCPGMPCSLLPVVAGVGIPRWIVKFRKARRIKQFLSEFPNALDIIVRAVKSGLPLNDGIRLIANEAQEPVKTEFRRIIEAQQVGLSIPEATLRMVDTMPCPEASFFGIVDPNPVPGRRQPCRGAGQSVPRAARPQEDEGQGAGLVDGGQGLRRHHRRAAVYRHVSDLPVEPKLHHAAFHRAGRAHHHWRFSCSGCRSACGSCAT